MIEFADGPAAGKALTLRRGPLFLRVVTGPLGGNVDALDQLTDRPEPKELVYAYRRVGPANWVHLRPGGRFAFGKYRIVPEQPAGEIMRSTTRWRAWCELQVELERPVPHAE